MYVVYCFPKPYKKVYLTRKDAYISDNGKFSVKDHLLCRYHNLLLNKEEDEYYFNFDIVIRFTEDVDKAEHFFTRDFALSAVNVLSGFIPEDFKIEKVD